MLITLPVCVSVLVEIVLEYINQFLQWINYNLFKMNLGWEQNFSRAVNATDDHHSMTKLKTGEHWSD